jgi:uncharacterized protein Smg (DUF494 family)
VGKIHFYCDTKNTALGLLGALDLQLNAAIVDCFYIMCLQEEYGDKDGVRRYFKEYGFETEDISFSNPFDWMGMLRNVTKDVTESVLNRTIFYKTELKKRTAEAKSLEQDVIKKKLENLQNANKLRLELMDCGINKRDAAQAVAQLLTDQDASIQASNKKSLFSFEA